MEAGNGRVDEAEGDPTPDVVKDAAVRMSMFLRYETC